MSTTTAVEKLKKLEAEASALRTEAKKEAMAAVKAALADLNGLGFRYRLVEEGDEPASVKRRGRPAGKITRKRDPNAPCDICGFATSPGHDGRKHRAQGKNKKPFTAKELDELGLAKK